MHSAITSVHRGAEGRLHGERQEAVMRMLLRSTKGEDPVGARENKGGGGGVLENKKKISGFGHRVYHTEDPRATIFGHMSRDRDRPVRQILPNG